MCVVATFVTSGFLNAKSLCRSPLPTEFQSASQAAEAATFLLRKIRRLVPPLLLFAVGAASMLSLCWSCVPVCEFWTRSETWDFFATTLVAPFRTHEQAHLPGCFERMHDWSINQPLYTLAWTWRSHVLIATLHGLGALNKHTATATAVLQLSAVNGALGHFFIGVSLAMHGVVQPNVLSHPGMVSLVAALLTVAARDPGVWRLVGPLSVAYLTMAIACAMTQAEGCFAGTTSWSRAFLWLLKCTEQLGRHSYTIYILSCPVQKFLVDIWGEWRQVPVGVLNVALSTSTNIDSVMLEVPAMSPSANFAISAPITIFLALGLHRAARAWAGGG